jgi:hypothetical protein
MMTGLRLPGISGMVKVASNHYLVAHDAKRPGVPRLGLVEIRADGPQYHVVDIDAWPSGEDMANDLEGICAVPGRANEFLLAESGFYPKYGKFGRVIKVAYDAGSARARYRGAFRPFEAPSQGAETPKHQQIEGIACVQRGRTIALLFAWRGHKTQPGTLVWGTLEDVDAVEPTFTEKGRCALSPDVIADRGAADLYAKAEGEAWEVLSVASLDAGDLGPFRSSVYSAGMLTVADEGEICFEAGQAEVLWDIEGLKIEALAAPADCLPTSGLSVAADDESYKGVWRPIVKSADRRPPSPMLLSADAREQDLELFGLAQE